MTTPIAQNLDNTMPLSGDNSGNEQTPNSNAQRLRVATPNGPVPSFLGDLLEAQQAFINAQYSFVQVGNYYNLVKAQNTHIQAQAEVLRRLGAFG